MPSPTWKKNRLATSFRNRAHLAELGTAVAKINHDLRNSLASASSVSDVLAGRSEDPRVQKAAPRLERALDGRFSLATQTLDYAKATAAGRPTGAGLLHAVARRIATEALGDTSGSAGDNKVPADVSVNADPATFTASQQSHPQRRRKLASASRGGGGIIASLSPRGLDRRYRVPGLPRLARENLFKPICRQFRAARYRPWPRDSRELAQGMGAT